MQAMSSVISLCMCYFLKGLFKNKIIKYHTYTTDLSANSNNDGGIQYSGTNNGSVKPKGNVIRLILSISFLESFLKRYITAQSARIINDHINQTYCIKCYKLLFFYFKLCVVKCRNTGTNQPTQYEGLYDS